LSGLTLSAGTSARPSQRVQFTKDAHPLVADLGGSFLDVEPGDTVSPSIRSAGGDWQELAYTVLHSVSGNQYYSGAGTFGPWWTSVMGPVRVPVLLARKLGRGEVVVAQIGQWSITAREDMDKVRARMAESALARLAHNIARWAGQPGVAVANR
jgi:hypothetical protein